MAARATGGGQATILICEDEPSLRDLMRISLGDGYVVAEAGDGEQAIELARDLRPDLVLLDLMLPGCSGLEVLRRLRAEPRTWGTPVVIVTAFAGTAERQEAEAAGADGFIAKPFDPAELTATVEELLARGR